MRTYARILAAALLATVTGTLASQGQQQDAEIHEAFPMLVPVDPAAVAVVPSAPLGIEMADAFQPGINVRDLGELSFEAIAEADRRSAEKYADVTPGPARVGLNRAIEPSPLTTHDALVAELDDNENIWTLAIQSPGAYGIRLHFAGFDVGDASVIVYADAPAGLIVRGPYTGSGADGDGDFWTATLPGDEVFIEIVGEREPVFEIAEITHFDRDPGGFMGTELDDGPPLLDCHLDVNCHGSVDWSAKMATGQMNWTDGEGSYSCTGTLLNDLDDETIVPYFLTARHCLHTQAEVDTLEVVWKYQTDTCGDVGSVPSWPSLPRNVGGLHLRSYDENDMEFMRLDGNLVGGLGLAGWTESTSSAQYGVHHPKGSWKRVVFLEDVIFGCPTFDPTDYDSYDQVDGLTQGGSSGSGAFNGSGQLAGQLWGICSATTDPKDLNCSNIDNFWTVYGEFEESWSKIGWYLIIGGTMYVDPASQCPIPQGTETCPHVSLETAIDAAWEELRIKIQTGSYPGPLYFDKPLTFMAMNGTVTIGAEP